MRRDLLRRMQAAVAAQVSDLARRRREQLNAAAPDLGNDDALLDLNNQIEPRERVIRRLAGMRHRAGTDRQIVMARRQEARGLDRP